MRGLGQPRTGQQVWRGRLPSPSETPRRSTSGPICRRPAYCPQAEAHEDGPGSAMLANPG